MAPKSKYARPPVPQDNSSSSTLDVNIQPKRKVVRSPSGDRAASSSSTLDGAQKPRTRARASRSTTIEAIIDMYGERPLPPVPRIPSSIYASSKRNTAFSHGSSVSPESLGAVASPPSPARASPITPIQTRFVTAKDLTAAKHLSQLFKKESGTKSSKPDVIPERRICVREMQPTEVSKAKAKPIKPIPFTEWKAPTYQEPSNSSKSSRHTPLSRRSASFDSPNASPSAKTSAEGRASSHFTVTNYAKSTNFGRGIHKLNPTHAGPRLSSATIKDVTKQANVPYPLLTCSLPESPPQSRFSPSSPNASDVDSLAGVTSSFRTRAKKALLQSKTPRRAGLKQRIDSNHSDISQISPTTSSLPSRRNSAARQPQIRNSMQQSLSDMYGTLQNIYTPAKRTSLTTKDPRSLRADQLSPSKKKLPTKEMRSPAIPLTEYQKYGRKAWEEPKKHAYIHRMPRKRLSKPQLPAFLTMTATTKSPDTTYNIEMPLLQTPKRPRSNLLFDHNYHIEMPSTTVPTLTSPSSPFLPARTNTTKAHRLSRSFTGSTSHENSFSNRLSRAEKKRMERYSLPLATRTRSKTDETTLSKVTRQAASSSAESKKGKSLGQKLASTLPALGLARREVEPVASSAQDLERERDQGRRDRVVERNGEKGRKTSSERRREELKKRIVVIGDPSAVGVPF